MPTHLREGIRLLRPKPLGTAVTAAFRRARSRWVRSCSGAGHFPAVRAALKWGQREWVELLRFDQWVAPFIATGGMNVDGIHWGWDCHREVGQRSAAILANSGSPGPAIAATDNGKRQRSSITSMQPDLLLTEPR